MSVRGFLVELEFESVGFWTEERGKPEYQEKNLSEQGREPNQRQTQPTYGCPCQVLESIFAGYVALASQSPYSIIVHSVANHRPHLSHFWANV